MTGAAPLLEVGRVSVNFGGLAALADVSLEASTGEVVGVIGPNGAGKTTLFNVICGFVTPDDGEILFDGRSIGRVRPNKLTSLGIARTLQGVGLWPSLTVVENVMAGLHRDSRAGVVSSLLGLPRSSRDERRLRERAMAALERLGVDRHATRLPTELPYPEQKRVSIARALVSNPRLIMLDEPASGLSEGDIEDLTKLIVELRADHAVLLVDHHMDFVMSACDRLVVLDFGRVIASGSPDTVRADPAVASAYLGEALT